MRTTENLSLRLDPEVVRLARRTAEAANLSLRDFFEGAVRRHVAAMTAPEETTSLLATVEQALLNRFDQRLRDALERVAALSAKEAIDQAQTLQMVKRLVYVACSANQAKTSQVINQAWDEAVERVRQRGRTLPSDAVETLNATLNDLEKKVAEQREALEKARADLQKAEDDYKKLYQENYRNEQDLGAMNKEAASLRAQLEREIWVAQQLEQQGMLGRKSAAEFRQLYNDRFRERRVTS